MIVQKRTGFLLRMTGSEVGSCFVVALVGSKTDLYMPSDMLATIAYERRDKKVPQMREIMKMKQKHNKDMNCITITALGIIMK